MTDRDGTPPTEEPGSGGSAGASPRPLQGTLADSQHPAPAYQPPAGYGPVGYWAPGGRGQWRNRAFGRSAPPAGSTNGMAIAALVLGLIGWVPYGIGSLLGIVCGAVAIRQLRASDQNGRSLAIAGIVLGALSALVIVVLLAVGRIVR